MTAVTYLTRHRRPGIVILCSIVAVLSMLFVLPPAIASAADSGAQAVDECNPTASNGCVNGILQDADKKPIADVTITLSGKATAETKTAADGKWAFSVADDGDYTVTIDASVAKEHGLKASSATVTIRKASFDKQRGVVRFDQAGDSAGSGTSGTSGSSGSANGTKGATGTSGSTAATQSPVKKDGSNVGKRIWQQLYSGIIFGLMLGLMSVGMNLVYGTTGLQSFSHGEQVTLGGLMAYVGTQMLHMPLIASAIFAIVIGALTGWYGGWVDEVLMRLNDALASFPSILILLVLVSLLGGGREHMTLALGIVFIPSYARIVRSEFARARTQNYVHSAELMGASTARILFVHILPNIWHTLVSAITIGFNNAVLAEAAMSYLSIGVSPDEASLGYMLSESQSMLGSAPWYALGTGAVIVLLILGVSLIGEGLQRRNGGVS